MLRPETLFAWLKKTGARVSMSRERTAMSWRQAGEHCLRCKLHKIWDNGLEHAWLQLRDRSTAIVSDSEHDLILEESRVIGLHRGFRA